MLTIVAAFAFVDDELVELINRECSLCGEYLFIDDFVEGEDWCKECEEENDV
jgi:ribosomal protein S27AE